MTNKNVDDNVTEQIKSLRKYLKIKLIEDNISFRNHELGRKHVYDIIKKSITNGESHSALIIGPRGGGKTTLINSVLHQVSKEVDLDSDAIIVKLNGLLHHDEKVALKSITSQMQLENAVGDRVFGTFAENLAFLLSCLQSGADRRCKSMVFILEEFDMFCHSGRTQTLLYNLFDITHNKQAPMCVLGITNRLDVIELLEKRVKSRFSHRHIFLFPNNQEENQSERSHLDMMMEVFVQLLSMPMIMEQKVCETPRKTKGRRRKKSIAEAEEMDIDNTNQIYATPEPILSKCKLDVSSFKNLNTSFLQEWNAHIKSLAEDQIVIDAVEKFCYYTVSERIFRNVLFQLVSKLSPKKQFIESSDIVTLIDKTVAPEHRVKLLTSLSILELSLVIAMKHGMDIFDGQPMNFEMVLHRYTKFANANSSTQSVPRPVILKAFEHLQALEIITPVKSTDSLYSNTGNARVQREYQLYCLAVPNAELAEAVKRFKALPTEISHWFNNDFE